jgi:hypothetical protein
LSIIFPGIHSLYALKKEAMMVHKKTVGILLVMALAFLIIGLSSLFTGSAMLSNHDTVGGTDVTLALVGVGFLLLDAFTILVADLVAIIRLGQLRQFGWMTGLLVCTFLLAPLLPILLILYVAVAPDTPAIPLVQIGSSPYPPFQTGAMQAGPGQYISCPSCRTVHPPSVFFCANCGRPLSTFPKELREER